MITATMAIVIAGNALLWGGLIVTHPSPPPTGWQTTVLVAGQ